LLLEKQAIFPVKRIPLLMMAGMAALVVPCVANSSITLNATTFLGKLEDTSVKWFEVIVDVRTSAEYELGHINGSTFVDSLAKFNTSEQVLSPDALKECEYCNIVVYCKIGERAEAAIGHLINAGFKGKLYNGQGTTQWTNAGYPLVNTTSVVPPCTTNTTVSDQCKAAFSATTLAPAKAPVSIATMSNRTSGGTGCIMSGWKIVPVLALMISTMLA
jgi:rhodanese-related sulfurtransferase